MGFVLTSHSMSLDGFIVQADRTPGPLHEWLWAGDHPSRHGENIKLSEASRQYFDESVDRVGATIAGRRTYEDSGRWGGELPFDWPFFIVTHRPPDDADDVPFTFVTEGVELAVELAKETAGDKNVTVMGGDIARQCLTVGLSRRDRHRSRADPPRRGRAVVRRARDRAGRARADARRRRTRRDAPQLPRPQVSLAVRCGEAPTREET